VTLLIRNMFPVIPGLFCMMILAGCAGTHQDVKRQSFDICSVVKNDIDLVTETHQRVVFAALKDLAVKLYKRNPREWKKDGTIYNKNVEGPLVQQFQHVTHLQL
jgi:hypothetical protein